MLTINQPTKKRTQVVATRYVVGNPRLYPWSIALNIVLIFIIIFLLYAGSLS